MFSFHNTAYKTQRNEKQKLSFSNHEIFGASNAKLQMKHLRANHKTIQGQSREITNQTITSLS